MSELIPPFLSEPSMSEDHIKIVSIAELLEMDIPPREMILSPIFQTQSLNMIHAYRGIGKTHVALEIAYAVASGGSFLKWTALKPRRVLYLDGEMPAGCIQERLATIVARSEIELPSSDYLRILTPDLQPLGLPDLSTTAGQVALDPYIQDVEFIVVDNISCLCRTGNENEAESWAPVQKWALRLRASGRSVLFIHHDGKNGGQRGTSKKEDLLDTVLGLKRPSDYEAEQGARFEVHFEKARHLLGDDTKPFEAILELDENGGKTWAFKDMSEATFEKIVVMANEGLKQVDIAIELGVNKSTVCRAFKRAKGEGRLGK